MRGLEVQDSSAQPHRPDPAGTSRAAGEGDPRLQTQRHHHPVLRPRSRHRKVTDECYDRHGNAEFLDFLKKVAETYPRGELHVVVDNYHTHKHDDINTWLARSPRITLHFTPTSGSIESVKELVAAIRTFIEGRNDRYQPFTWTKTADDILPLATRKRDSDARH